MTEISMLLGNMYLLMIFSMYILSSSKNHGSVENGYLQKKYPLQQDSFSSCFLHKTPSSKHSWDANTLNPVPSRWKNTRFDPFFL